jgi:hypothetical protein
MDDGWMRCERAGCTKRLHENQKRFCSDSCRVADWRDGKRERQSRTCTLCGDPFAVRYRNQRVCDYNSAQASDDCLSMQDELMELREELQEQRESATCERESCEESTYRPGRGRPKRFCSPRCKTAHYRAEKQQPAA